MSNQSYNLCPKSGEPCEMAGWTADHIRNQFVVPKKSVQEAIPFILKQVMECDGIEDSCSPAAPDTLDTAVSLFNEASRNESEATTA